MKFTPGPLISEARGSQGGTTFSRNRFGPYTRTRAVPVNPSSGRQQVVRAVFSALAVAWTTILVDAERTAWNLYGANVVMKDSLGQDIFLTGFNHFLRSNTVVNLSGLTTVASGPTIFTLAESDDTAVATASEATQLISLAFDDTLAWLDEDGAAMQVSMSRPQGAGTQFIKGPNRIAGVILGNSTTPPTTPTTFTAPYVVTAGQVLEVQMRILRADGRLSEPFLDTLTAGA